MVWRGGAAVVSVLIIASVLGAGGCRHLGFADEPDVGPAVVCSPCSDYGRRVYRCVMNACEGVECSACDRFLKDPEPSCVPDEDGGSGATAGKDAGAGVCVCDLTYGCDPGCPCDSDCAYSGSGSDAGGVPCTGAYRKYMEEKLKTFACEDELSRYDVDLCPKNAELCAAAGGVCETGFVYFAPDAGSVCACMLPGSTGVGEVCSAPNDCVPGAVCLSYDQAKICFRVCGGDGACGDGEVCATSKYGFSVCHPY